MGYNVKELDVPIYGGEDTTPSPGEIRAILREQWDEYEEWKDTAPGTMLSKYAELQGGAEPHDVDDLYDESVLDNEDVVAVDDVWEDVLENHAAAEGYDV